MTIKIIVTRQSGALEELIEAFGTFYIESSEAISEKIRKFECPVRLSNYIDELEAKSLIVEVDETDKVDFTHDLSEQSKDIADKILLANYNYDNYIEQTSHLNQYGA